MKRILSLVLALMMIISSMAIISSAAPSEQCLELSGDNVYSFLTNMSINATDSSISFEISMAADAEGAPVLAINAGAVEITPTHIKVGSQTKSIEWGEVASTHWRRVELQYTSAGCTVYLDGVQVTSVAGQTCRTDGVILIGYPGIIMIDNFKVVSAGVVTTELNFEDEGEYLNHKHGDSTASRSPVPEGSYCDYEEVVLPDNIEYIFDSAANCESLTIGSEETILIGDLTGDGIINARDILKMKRVTIHGEAVDTRKADFNEDGLVNGKDSLMMKRTVSGLLQAVTKVFGSAEALPFEATQQSAKFVASETVSNGIDATLNMSEISSDDYKYAVITYMTPNSSEISNSDAAVESAFGAYGNLVSYELNTDGRYHAQIVDLSNVSTWNGDSATLRLFVGANVGDTIYIDSIIFTASLARANSVATAREAAKASYSITDAPIKEGLGYYFGDDYVVPFNSEGKLEYVSNSNNSRIEYSATQNAIKATATAGADPSIYVDLTEEGISADTYKYIVYTYNMPTTVQRQGPKANFYYVCGNIDVPTGGYECPTFSCTKSSEFKTQIVDLSANSNWSGSIKGLRIDYFTDAIVGDCVYIDSLVFCKSLSAANTAARLRLEERYGVAEVDAAGVWNNYWNYYQNQNGYEFIAGSATNLQMYFKYSSESALTARSLGDRFARAISNATGYEVTAEVYGGFVELHSSWSNSSPNAYVFYTIRYNGEAYVVRVKTNIIKDSSYSDVLDGTSADPQVGYENTSNWASDGYAITDSKKLASFSSYLAYHSNHEAKMLKTPYGTFAVYHTYADMDRGNYTGAGKITLFRIYDDGSYKALGEYSVTAHTTKPQLIYGDDGLVYFICPDDDFDDPAYASISLGYFDPSKPNADGSYNITYSRTNRAYPGGDAPGGYGYSQPVMDKTTGKIQIFYCGGRDELGFYVCWFTYNYRTHQWEGGNSTVMWDHYRNCYLYTFPDGKGGMYIIGERACLLECVGLKGIVYNVNYAWDEITMFHIPDMTKSGYTAQTIVPADYSQVARELYPTTGNNANGDVYITSDNKMHVLTTTRMHGRDHHDTQYYQMWHTVYDIATPGAEPKLLFNEPIAFASPSNFYCMRMIENTDGELHILAMPVDRDARVEIWKADDSLGKTFSLVACQNFTQKNEVTTSLIICSPRNGSIVDNKVPCMYPIDSSGQSRYMYFEVTLP